MQQVMMGLIAFAVLLLILLAWAVFNWMSAAPPRAAVGELRQIEMGKIRLSYYVHGGSGMPVVLVPSLGRAASDFNELVEDLARAGHRTIAIEPRGMLDKTGLDDDKITLFDLAQDVAQIIAKEAEGKKIVMIGHAFGNRVARAYAMRDSRVSHIILIAAGGKVDLAPRIRDALVHSFWFFMPDFWRREEIRLAFFAGDNKIPDYWIGGWNIGTSQVQGKAVKNTPSPQWWAGGSAPMLVVQGMRDRIAPNEHTAVLLKEEFGARVRVAEIENAGHALLPEQRQQISAVIINFIGGKK